MNRKEIFEQFQSLCQDVFDDEDIVLDDLTTADDVEEWDSMNHVQLIVKIEKHFNLKFELTELQRVRTVGEFVDLIESRL